MQIKTPEQIHELADQVFETCRHAVSPENAELQTRIIMHDLALFQYAEHLLNLVNFCNAIDEWTPKQNELNTIN